MATSSQIRGRALADFQRGWRVSFEDLAIAMLVTLPFTVALMVLVSQISGLPSLWIMILTAIVQVLATFWNAGWRAHASD